jgi:hypothetical protein
VFIKFNNYQSKIFGKSKYPKDYLKGGIYQLKEKDYEDLK